jgi:hypothetical protein
MIRLVGLEGVSCFFGLGCDDNLEKGGCVMFLRGNSFPFVALVCAATTGNGDVAYDTTVGVGASLPEVVHGVRMATAIPRSLPFDPHYADSGGA